MKPAGNWYIPCGAIRFAIVTLQPAWLARIEQHESEVQGEIQATLFVPFVVKSLCLDD